MTRVAMTDPVPTEPELKLIYDELLTVAGADFRLPNLYRVLGRVPKMFRAWIDFAWPLRLHAQSSRRLRELMILRGAQVSRTDYEWAHHIPLALAAGVTQEEIDALKNWEQSGLFSAQDKSAIRLAQEITQGPSASAECMNELKQHFSEEQVVELTLTASFYVCVGRFLKSMDVPLEADFEHLRPAQED